MFVIAFYSFSISKKKIKVSEERYWKVLISSYQSWNHFYNIVRLFDVLPNFLLSQEKLSATISNKRGT